jgi:hypothetical protein
LDSLFLIPLYLYEFCRSSCTAAKTLYGDGKSGDLSKTAHQMLHMCEKGRRRRLLRGDEDPQWLSLDLEEQFLPVQHKGHDCRSALAKMFEASKSKEKY